MTPTHPRVPDDATLAMSVEILRLLADRTRLAILAMISEGEMSVSAIAEALERPAPSVSQHLAKLRAGHLVATRREGTTIFYSQPDEHIAALVTNVLDHIDHMLVDERA
ncbi:winged helix-turn-helix transcriptional regulator [Nanchangia anserum]|uniref:Winged helix-turn-helix transcriptional regulator n=1 Tax=Nanchangia anserum TaxID=2692125 RepID=A0A8I0GBV7_9ACTO|nr:metalloregulator ArsR/SmtB family transcription factor [Nanchangia anserum]MBD3688713.1 winged helix-turn-helix transcriptional regulator [Nanchangia anserum]QOX82460.1 winged helix-turn-helix transcriptional regulator [Nanchangia anserum]